MRENDPVVAPAKLVNFGLVAIEIGRDLNQKPGDQVNSEVKSTWQYQCLSTETLQEGSIETPSSRLEDGLILHG